MYARVVNNTIDTLGGLPNGARRLDDGAWVTPPKDAWTQSDLEACGWFEVQETLRPDDTDTMTHDRSVELVDGTPVVVWTPRDRTAEELALVLEEEAPSVTDVLAAKLVEEANTTPPEWTQPQGAHDAYLPGAIVTDGPGGDRHQNTLSVPNVWGLTVHGWVNLDATVPTDPQPFVQPTGAHDAYNIGDLVTFEGSTYESQIDANTYSPTAYPAGWLLVTAN